MSPRLTREQLLAVFQNAWKATQNPADVAEAIQIAVLARVEASDAEANVTRIGPRSGRRLRDWTLDADPRIEQIIDSVSRFRGVTVEQIKGNTKEALVVRARFEAAWLIRVVTGISYESIGVALGGRGHQPILAACRKIAELVAADASYGARLRALVSVEDVRAEAA
jgi:chromosomal replication initiation ATPase DnaA